MIPVVYSDKMSAKLRSFSPSAEKPKLVMNEWLSNKEPIFIVEPKRATKDDFLKAHSVRYVEGVLSGRISNGFGTKDIAVTESLHYTVGGMLTAVKLSDIAPVICVPVSGFHHAGYGSGGGFCTFNGNVIAALSTTKKVALVDCDMHYGDGTEGCLRMTGNQTKIRHATFGQWYHQPSEGEMYLDQLRTMWSSNWFAGIELILYQAGADVHVDDPLGGVLTTEQMIERDRIMFEGANKAGIPIIWVLAGGYQSPISKVLDLHSNTLHECIKVFGELNCTENLVAVQ